MIPLYEPDPQKVQDFRRRFKKAAKRRRRLRHKVERQEREFWAKVPQAHKEAIVKALMSLRDG